MWVQFKKRKAFERSGVKVVRHPGDWDEIGRQAALQWQVEGAVYIPPAALKKATIIAPGTTGVLVTHGDIETARDRLGLDVEYDAGDPALHWGRTVIWDGLAAFRPALIPIGLGLLDTWEVAAPLCDYDHLARDEGDDAEREQTAAIIRDLRVMLYDPRLLFIRKTENTDRLIIAWKQEKERGANERLAFLRALYRTPLLMLPLPVTWLGQ